MKSRLRVLLTSWALFFLAAALWAVATPIAGTPDEPAHLVKAASVARGELVGDATNVGHEVTVPQYIAWSHAWTCYAFNGNQTADCVPPMPTEPDLLVTSVTMAGLYNPVYYAIVGWPTLVFGDDTGIYAMRMITSLVTTFFIAAAIAVVSAWRRPVLPLLGIAAVTTPMLLFLSAAVNPNAIEATTTLAVFVSMYSLIRERARDPWVVALVTIAASLGSTARGLSPLWIAIAILLPLLLLTWREAWAFLRRRDILVGAAVIAVSAGASVLWTLGSSSLTAGATDPEINIIYPGAGDSPVEGFVNILARTFDFGAQMIGLFGWMDTWAPAVALFVYTVLIGMILVLAWLHLRGRALRQVVVAAGALVLLPAAVQAAYVTAGGYIWQGRYSLALFAIVMIAATTMLGDRLTVSRNWMTLRRGVWLAAGALLLAQVASFVIILKRYAVGADGGWGEFLRSPDWAPPLGVPVVLAAFALVCAVGTLLSARGVMRLAASERSEVDADADERADGEPEHHTL